MRPQPESQRIVSLIASATEIVARLGLEDQLVGCSHECDFPASVHELPDCSRPRIDVNGTSRQIDERVKGAVRDALSVYDVRMNELQELRPTMIITQTQCDVCAVNLRDVEAAVCKLVNSNPTIVSLEPNALADIWDDIGRVATAAGIPENGSTLVQELKAELETIRHRVSNIPDRPRVACVEWLDPLMAAGNWIPELVEIAGGTSVFGEAGKHSPWMTWEALAAEDPDVILTMPCGFDIPRTMEEIHLLTERPDWKDLKAVQSGRVFVADGNSYFNRPGPRVTDSAWILAELLHPEVFEARFEGIGWVPVPG